MSEEILFTEALSLAADQRDAYLDRVCAGNPELRRRLEELLAAHAASGDLLAPHRQQATEAYAPSSANAPNAAEPPPTTAYRTEGAVGTLIAGRYKLLQQIGEGGMGTVWMAEQTEPVKRKVAVKLIRVERSQSKAILARFEAERQAIALMDHPHIAKLLDAGTTDTGSPFFVMELVKGIPLNDFCDQHRLEITERLQLFMQICSAVQHAHQKGIIHRDLKPSNILVESHDGKPVPKVIDFGLAKATTGLALTEQSLFTGFGNVLGTPLYMAPEQASFNAVDVDTRADIYALGIVLYELLTGTTPITRDTLKKVALDEMLRLVREQEVPTPSSRLSSSETKANVAANRHTEPAKLGRYLRGELDWIVLKALSKERDRRYETANGFAKDIERFLNHEPVTAGPPTAGYRIKKFVQRNRPQVIAASLVFLALVAGVIGTTVGLLEARRQAVIAREEAAAKEKALKAEAEERRKAEAERKKAIEFRDQALAALRATTGTDVEKLIGAKKELSANERAYLEAIAQRWQAFAMQDGTDEQSRAIQAEGFSKVAFLWLKLDRRDEAGRTFPRAIALWRQLVADYPAVPDYRLNLARSQTNLGLILVELGKPAEAEEQSSLAVTNLQQLVADFPAVPDHRSNLALSHTNLGIILVETGQREKAEEHYKKGLAILEQLAIEFPIRSDFRSNQAHSHSSLASLLWDLGKRPAAEEQFRKSLAILEELAADFPANSDYRRELSTNHNNLALVLAEAGKLAEAEEQYRKALTIGQELAADFPAIPGNRQLVADINQSLSLILIRQRKWSEAEKLLRQAIKIQEALAGEFPGVPVYRLRLAKSHSSLGNLFLDVKQWAAAEEQLRRGLAIREKLAADFPDVLDHRNELAKSHTNLGGLLADLGKFPEAEVAHRRALAIREKLVAEFPTVLVYRSSLAGNHTNLGVVLVELGKEAEAEEQYRKGLAIFESLATEVPTVPKYRLNLALSHSNLGNLLRNLGKRQEAVEQHRIGLAIREKLSAEFPTNAMYRADLASSYFNLGYLFQIMDEDAEAVEQYRKGLAIWEKLVLDFPAVPDYRVSLGGSYCNLGLLLRSSNPAASLEWFDKAIATLNPVYEASPQFIKAKQFLRNGYLCRAVANHQLQRFTEAVADWDQVVELSQSNEQPQFRASRAVSSVSDGQIAKAVAEVDELRKLPRWNADTLYDFACIYAAASAKATDKQEEYAATAVEMLKRAVLAGFKDAARLKVEAKLESLREREDYKNLITDLEKATEKE